MTEPVSMQPEATQDDVINAVADLAPGSPVATLRWQRPEIVRRSQTSHDAALMPRDPGAIDRAERAALACRMARLTKDGRLAAHYEALLADARAEPPLDAVADPAARPALTPRLAAMVGHVDRVTLAPGEVTRGDIEGLQAAGLSDRDIVTLAGLIAFVNYQVRVIAGLRMLGAG